MKTFYLISSFFIFVLLVLYVKYLYVQNGTSFELPQNVLYLIYGVTFNSIIALTVMIKDALTKKEKFIK